MNLTVPRDRLFGQSDGTLWFVVEGEPCPGCETTTEPHAVWGELGQPPPADLVALAAPCETCMGKTRYEGDGFVCPDCEEVVRCDHAAGDYTTNLLGADGPWTGCNLCKSSDGMVARKRAHRTLTITTDPTLTYGDDWDRISLGPFRVEAVVPIRSVDDARATLIEEAIYIAGGMVHHWARRDGSSWHAKEIDLGPNPEQFFGQYAVKAVSA